MKVWGLASMTGLPAISPTPTSACESFRFTRIECSWASRSTTMKPRLCGAYALPDQQLAHVDSEVLGNLIRQALDLDRTRYNFEQSALCLDALWLAHSHNGHRNPQALGKIDALQIGVQQVPLDRVELLVD